MRIDPAAVLAACRARPECKVRRHGFGDGVTCGCPLTLFSLTLPPVEDERHPTVPLERLSQYGRQYIRGFWWGIDDIRLQELEDGMHEGYADGTATRELLVREGVMT